MCRFAEQKEGAASSGHRPMGFVISWSLVERSLRVQSGGRRMVPASLRFHIFAQRAWTLVHSSGTNPGNRGRRGVSSCVGCAEY